METKTLIVSPQVARDWLKRNVNNRPLRATTVAGLKAAFQRGEYVLTHQGIGFDTDGNLIDGQHRLTAISEMPDDFRVEMMVTRGLPRKAFEVLDIGVKRSNSDVLRVAQGLAASARFMATIVESNRSGITPSFLVPYISGIEDTYATLTSYTPTVTRTWASAAVRSAAVLRMLGGADMDYVLLSYHALNHAEFDSMSRVIQSLYRQQTQGRVRGNLDLFARCYRAFDNRKAALDTIQITDQSNVISAAREAILVHVLGQKKAGVMPAKKVNGVNSSRAKAHA